MDDDEAKKIAKEFDAVLTPKVSFSDFCRLFEKYEGVHAPFKYISACDPMLEDAFLVKCNKYQLHAILSCTKMDDITYQARLISHILRSNKYPENIKAFFWSVAKRLGLKQNCSYPFIIRLAREGTLVCNDDILNAMRKNKIGTQEELQFIDEVLSLNFRRAWSHVFKPGREQLIMAIRKDSIPLFEIHRQILGMECTISLMEVLIEEEAPNIFFHLLRRNPNKILHMRSINSWIIAIFRNVFVSDAIKFAEGFEKYEPGIVSKVRDPWDNTLLHYFCFKFRLEDELFEKRLIELGCDPNSPNHLGITAKQLKENLWFRSYAK